MIKSSPLTIARYSLLEAARGKILWVFVALAVLALLLALFVSQTTLTETRETQVAIIAGFLRLAAVLVMIFFVISSVARDFQDKSIELLFAIAIPRYQVFIGKFSGFVLLALVSVLIFFPVIALFAPVESALFWSISLWFELVLVALLALIFILSLESVALSLVASIGSYGLMRIMPAIQSIGEGPFQDSLFNRFINGLLDLIDLFLPRLDHFTQSHWLVMGEYAVIDMVTVALEFVLFVALFAMIGILDLKRKAI